MKSTNETSVRAWRKPEKNRRKKKLLAEGEKHGLEKTAN